MHTFGVINLYVGGIMTALGLILGFYQMFTDSAGAISWLVFVPFGTVFMLLGTTIVLFYRK